MALLGAAVYDRLQTFIYGDYEVAFSFFTRAFAAAPGATVVDIGCGTGLLSTRFTEAGFNYTGVDFEASRIASARRRNPRARFLHGDLTNPEILSALDLRYCIMHGVTHHVSDDDFRTLLTHLRAHGLKVLCTMDPVRPEGWARPLARLACDFDDGKFVRDEAGYRALYPADARLTSHVHQYPRWPASILYLAASF